MVISHSVFFFEYKFPFKYAQLIHLHFFANGNLGVNFFFVLSGFLISWLLLTEKAKTNKINLPHFYLRRVLRIWPVYFILVFIGFFIGRYCNFSFITNPLFTYKIDMSQLKWYVAFLANYDLIFNTIKSVLLSVLWSVSVEEQFYLFWPLLILLVNKKYFPHCCALIITSSLLWRVCYNQTYLSYVSSFSVMSDLAFGGLICYYSLYSNRFLNYFKSLKKSNIYLVYALFFAYIPLHGFSHIFGEKVYSIYAPFEPIFFSCFFCFILLEQNFSENSFYKFGRMKLFTKLGKMSYGLYAYHMLSFPFAFYIADCFQLTTQNFWHYVIKILVVVLVTFLISFISYTFIERKFLELKEKYSKI